MSKKYFITDEDGEETVIEEVDSIDEPEEEELHDEVEPLTEDEILALKRLAQVADKIIEKLGTADACKDDEFEEEEELVDEEPEEEELLDEEPEEEIVDTDEEEEIEIKKEIPAKHDSKKSFGSIKKSVKKTEDSIEKSLDVESAWSKRYGGTK